MASGADPKDAAANKQALQALFSFVRAPAGLDLTIARWEGQKLHPQEFEDLDETGARDSLELLLNARDVTVALQGQTAQALRKISDTNQLRMDRLTDATSGAFRKPRVFVGAKLTEDEELVFFWTPARDAQGETDYRDSDSRVFAVLAATGLTSIEKFKEVLQSSEKKTDVLKALSALCGRKVSQRHVNKLMNLIPEEEAYNLTWLEHLKAQIHDYCDGEQNAVAQLA